MEDTPNQNPPSLSGPVEDINNDNLVYTAEQKNALEKISLEAKDLFVVGEIYPTPLSLSGRKLEALQPRVDLSLVLKDSSCAAADPLSQMELRTKEQGKSQLQWRREGKPTPPDVVASLPLGVHQSTGL